MDPSYGSDFTKRLAERRPQTLAIKPGRLQRPLDELMGGWWKQGVETMLKNSHLALD